MSQAKVDKHKQEKYNRKKNVKKRNFKKIAAYVVATLIAIAFIGYIGYSVAIDTGLYTPATTTQGSTLSKEAIESLRQQLIKTATQTFRAKQVMLQLKLLQQLQVLKQALLNKIIENKNPYSFFY